MSVYGVLDVHPGLQATGVAVGVCQRALKAARKSKVDALILDTAGRLHIDEPLMKELEQIARRYGPLCFDPICEVPATFAQTRKHLREAPAASWCVSTNRSAAAPRPRSPSAFPPPSPRPTCSRRSADR